MKCLSSYGFISRSDPHSQGSEVSSSGEPPANQQAKRSRTDGTATASCEREESERSQSPNSAAVPPSTVPEVSKVEPQVMREYCELVSDDGKIDL